MFRSLGGIGLWCLELPDQVGVWHLLWPVLTAVRDFVKGFTAKDSCKWGLGFRVSV